MTQLDEMDSDPFESTGTGRTGKYTVLMELGSGGSAVVSAALVKGIAGFSKVVALKTIREGLGDESTVRMFLSEARVTARMNHPNVVQVYEVFKKKNLPVIVMEYLEGQSFARLLSKCFGTEHLANELGIAILTKALSGLHYAHSLTEYNGEPLHLVHRDVSPHNVMVCYDGQVKLVDFGIAKLNEQRAQTRTGIIKGKLNYMAPEQVGGEMDRRADIFAVGVMLWEIVAGRRLWGKAGEAQVIGSLLSHKIPKLQDFAPDVDPELDRICAKALAADPDERYSTAEEMQKELDSYLRRSNADVSQAAIADVMGKIYGKAREECRAALQQKVHALGMSATGEFEPDDGNELLQASIVPMRQNSVAREPPPHRPWLASVAGIGALVVATLALVKSVTVPPVAAPQLSAPAVPQAHIPALAAKPTRVHLNISTTPQTARIYLDNRLLASNPFRDTFPRDSKNHTFRAEAEGFEPFEKTIGLASDLEVTVSLKAVPPAPVWQNKMHAKSPAKSPPKPRSKAPASVEPPKPVKPLTVPVIAVTQPATMAPGESLVKAQSPSPAAGRKAKFDEPYQ